jgi:uncharacterized iron-regulated protein
MARSALLAAALCISLLTSAGCTTTTPLTPKARARLLALLPADVLLLGEQHDAPDHQQLQRQTVQWLADQGRLAAVAMEMAERGHSTAGLAPSASESTVRAALAWDNAGWPWKTYGPVVMTAVRAGVPVLGANLPMRHLRGAMADASLDARLPPLALQTQRQRIREGHCDALPEAQIGPMTRVQIARDRAMADTVVSALQPGKTVLMIAGNGHVERSLGVPLHLPGKLVAKVVTARAASANFSASPSEAGAADLIWTTPPRPLPDYCAEFRARPASARRSAEIK